MSKLKLTGLHVLKRNNFGHMLNLIPFGKIDDRLMSLYSQGSWLS